MSEKAEAIMDGLLNKQKLARKSVPKDGACMFRCISEEVYGSQVLHPLLRAQCVRYMKSNADTFLPFIVADSDLPWDHYLFELTKLETWGGYLELLALAKMLKINFIIHTENSSPTVLDHGFARTVHLAFSGGNHYDLVMSEDTTNIHKCCQGLIYELISSVLEAHGEQINYDVATTSYKNIAFDCWIADQKKQESRDQLITKKILEAPQNYATLSGYYKKETANEQTVNKDQKKKPRKRGNKTSTNNPATNNSSPNNSSTKTLSTPTSPCISSALQTTSLSHEDLELQAILAQIEEVEKKQLNNIAFNNDFPVLKSNANIVSNQPAPSIVQPVTSISSSDNTPTNSPSVAPPKSNAWKSPKSWNAEPKSTQ